MYVSYYGNGKCRFWVFPTSSLCAVLKCEPKFPYQYPRKPCSTHSVERGRFPITIQTTRVQPQIQENRNTQIHTSHKISDTFSPIGFSDTFEVSVQTSGRYPCP